MTHPAPPDMHFKQLPLSHKLLETLEQLSFHQMTPIQAATLPLALAGQDVIAQAKTGSGKTVAFALPLLSQVHQRWFAIQGLVLCPTRELADQVAQEIRRLARAIPNLKVLTLCGGSPMGPQIGSLEHGGHLVVGTPGRVMDHLERGTLNLDGLKMLVLDEADRMLDMGFYDSIAYIARFCPQKRQTLMFSATYPEGVMRIANQFMYKPQQVKLEQQHSSDKIQHLFVKVEQNDRLNAVGRLLRHYQPESSLAFCNTKEQCRQLLDVLLDQGIYALMLHGDLDQRERDQVLIQFANRSCNVLIATDVAARGLDINKLAAVFNVDVTPDPEVFVHRVGRTGRAEQQGLVFNLVGPRDERRIGVLQQHLQINEPNWQEVAQLNPQTALLPPMQTLQILGGRKEKMRPGDVLGALTANGQFTREQIGKINVTDFSTYVAVDRNIAQAAQRKLEHDKVKGRNVKVRLM